MVDSTTVFDYMSSLDAMSGYHQIPMDRSDEEKTSFITEDGTYCYRAMPFGLKNVGATYQRLMNKIFKGHIGRNVEVYVDDMVVKSQTFQQHMADLKEVFGVLEQYKMRLNPAKCAFFIRGGKFLGYMVNGKGIEPNPEKVEAILRMPEPICVRDVQRLTRRVVALDRFMSKFAERCLPFFKKLRKVPNFEWTEDCHSEEIQSVSRRPSRSSDDGPAFKEDPPQAQNVRTDSGLAELNKKPSEAMEEESERQPSREFSWKLYVDGASSAGGSGAGVMLKGLEGFKVYYALRLEFSASNNIAEYEALINEMLIAMEIGATDLEINSDSQLVVNQIMGAYQARDPTMLKYLAKVKAIEAELGEQGVNVEEGQSWMTSYLEYLEKGKLPEDKAEARKIAARAPNYQAIRGTLYKRGRSSPWLQCVGPEEATRVMEEIHQGICRAHERAGTLANKIFRQGYYWPTVKKET
ncbi:uncharacterized protein LOC110607500 [Manihot esculenta]|uniref:uncharacterized protein LOC110607500 n=1 Tax=Manihot esculenta TaxID=3983 RepID=UPI000B5D1708|nr:uncharacterized protein LOC110607500 [Manihot esculenta]